MKQKANAIYVLSPGSGRKQGVLHKPSKSSRPEDTASLLFCSPNTWDTLYKNSLSNLSRANRSDGLLSKDPPQKKETLAKGRKLRKKKPYSKEDSRWPRKFKGKRSTQRRQRQRIQMSPS